ncbi:MAG: response regulator transcription factor [Scytonema sp. RU_4_4]|nr:response regulator transcription factor [Scytonema sp. RU_4_4]
MKILLVEDDERIAEALAEALTDQHYAVDIASDGEVGLEFVETFPYDLIVLDLMLPKLDGIRLCQQLRQKSYSMPILMLTAKDTSTDKVIGLDAGADDYVVKPFDLSELMARIRALLRRVNTTLLLVLEWENLRLYSHICQVRYQEKIVNLTPKEYRILELFLRNTHKAFNRSEILEHLWSFDEPPGEETIKVHIRSLRQKLKSAGADADFIETIYGLGYRLKQAL